jgi:hypothetical protein
MFPAKLNCEPSETGRVNTSSYYIKTAHQATCRNGFGLLLLCRASSLSLSCPFNDHHLPQMQQSPGILDSHSFSSLLHRQHTTVFYLPLHQSITQNHSSYQIHSKVNEGHSLGGCTQCRSTNPVSSGLITDHQELRTSYPHSPKAIIEAFLQSVQ